MINSEKLSDEILASRNTNKKDEDFWKARAKFQEMRKWQMENNIHAKAFRQMMILELMLDKYYALKSGAISEKDLNDYDIGCFQDAVGHINELENKMRKDLPEQSIKELNGLWKPRRL